MKCYHYEWDEDFFVVPKKYILDKNSDLANALHVFYLAGGYMFFNVKNPDHYASHWLDFMGNLFESIIAGKYVSSKAYIIPLTSTQKYELTKRGVPNIFITDVK